MLERLGSLLPERIDKALQRRWFDYFLERRYQQYVATLDGGQRPIVVFQMGKVGSSTVVETLNKHCPQLAPYQVHVLTHEWIATVERQYRHASIDHGRPSIDEHVLTSRYLRTLMDREPKRRWKVISIVRDPIARNISTFFQSFPVYFSKESGDQGEAALGTIAIDDLIRLFLEQFGERRHNMPLAWFQTHMQPAFGVDVYATPFDRDRGFTVIEDASCDLLLLRTETLRATLPEALQEFLGISIPGVEDSNVSSDKDYAMAYRAFKSRLTLPKEYLDRMYDSVYSRHFYSDEDIHRFRRAWSP